LARIVEIAERGKDGDLTIVSDDFGYKGRNELGSLVASLSDMISFQRATLLQVADTSDAVIDSTQALSALSRDNSAAMSQTKSLIGEVSRLCDANAEAAEKGMRNISDRRTGPIPWQRCLLTARALWPRPRKFPKTR
jgi:methyl-accepting chemotaxis protein